MKSQIDKTAMNSFIKKIAALIINIVVCNSFSIAQPTLIGMTMEGGDGFGTIFKTDINGNNHQIISTFKPNFSGSFSLYVQLCEATNGKLYGTTKDGGANNSGVLYEYDYNSNTYTKKFDFDDSLTGTGPSSAPILAGNGKLYGTTNWGGTSGYGVLYEYDFNTNTFTKKHDFNLANEFEPRASVIDVGNGKLYGMTYVGGAHGKGAIYEYDYLSNTYTKKYDFDGTSGSNGNGALIKATNGKLYGMTNWGGTSGKGVIFEYDYLTNSYSKKYDFNSIDGENPLGSLLEDSGKLYGMTKSGGNNNYGVLFEYDYSTATFTKKYDFSSTSGIFPEGSLIKATNGKIYGMTTYGLPGGTIFEFDHINNIYTKLFDFTSVNGESPSGSLMQANNGKLYGVTSQGGNCGAGVLFEYTLGANIYLKKFDFGAVNGSRPNGSFIQATNGKLYGMAATSATGINSFGVIFEYDYLTNAYIKKHDFDGINGKEPTGSLIQASNGKLYGMAGYGGINNDGVIFEYDITNNTYIKKIDLNPTIGRRVFGSLIEANNNKLYGMTFGGGANDRGVIFEYDYLNNIYTKKINLGGLNGSYPSGSLLQASNGKLYGMTSAGGSSNLGVLFEYDYINNIFIKKFDFSTLNGSYPNGSLIQAVNGKLYGMTTTGGINDKGTIFEYDYNNNSYNKLFDFGGVNGGYPYGSLMQSSNGKLYGLTHFYVGAPNRGSLFEYDYNSNVYTKKIDFNGPNGMAPLYNNLIEICSVNIGVTINGNSLVSNATGANYQWLDCNNGLPISGATNQNYLPSSSGNYAVIVSQNGCTDTSTCYSFVLTGISEWVAQNSVLVFPNPSKGIFSIKSTQKETIEIINNLGQVVKTVYLNLTNNYETTIDNINNGVYYIINSEKTYKQKIVVIN